MSRWAVAIAKRGSEGQISEDALSFGIDSYFPVCMKWRKLPKHLAKKKGKLREIVSVPLISGYMFISIRNRNDVRCVLSIKGVYGFIRIGDSICFARESEVLEFKADVESGIYNDTCTMEQARIDSLREQFGLINLFDLRGKEVKIKDGFFSGKNAEVESVNKDFREAKLNLSGTRIVIGLDQLQLCQTA